MKRPAVPAPESLDDLAFLRRVGRLLGVQDGTAVFEGGELVQESCAADHPTALRWWEPVHDSGLAAELRWRAMLFPRPEGLGGEVFGGADTEGAIGWTLVSADGTWVVGRQGWHRIVDAARVRERPGKTNLDRAILLGIRALATLAPGTPASVAEVQAISGLREGLVRAARPDPAVSSGRRINGPVGPWLQELAKKTTDPAEKGEEPSSPRAAALGAAPRGGCRSSQRGLKPLGGPGRSRTGG